MRTTLGRIPQRGDWVAERLIDLSSLRSSALVFGTTGIASGVVGKLIDGWNLPVLTDLVANLGLWVLVVALIGSLSPSGSSAVARAVAFLIGMLAGYFSCSALLFDYLPQRYALGWLVVALVLGAPFALIAWYSKGDGWRSACAAAIPVGMLLLSALPSLFIQQPAGTVEPAPLLGMVEAFDLLAAASLAFLLPRGNRQRLRSLALALPFGLVVTFAFQLVWLESS